MANHISIVFVTCHAIFLVCDSCHFTLKFQLVITNEVTKKFRGNLCCSLCFESALVACYRMFFLQKLLLGVQQKNETSLIND